MVTTPSACQLCGTCQVMEEQTMSCSHGAATLLRAGVQQRLLVLNLTRF